MVAYTTEEKTDMILIFGECLRDPRRAAAMYAGRYPLRPRHPAQSTFRKLERNLRLSGTFVRRNRAPRRDRVVGNEEEETTVLALVQANPHIGSRAVAQEVGYSQKTVLAILRRHKYHPYHIHLHQALNEEDKQRRVEFCLNYREMLGEDDNFTSKVFFSDESTFSRDGTVNTHNMHYWSEENPHWLRDGHHQVRWSTNVWAGILGDRIIGPFFFHQPINGEIYLNHLTENVEDFLDDLPLAERQRIWFQQDGAPPHYAIVVRQWLNEEFGNRWIGRGGPFPWPPRSPDLTPLDYFLWGYVKSKVYETEPLNLQDLEDRIRNAFATITPEMLQNVRRSLEERLEECIDADGGHFEHLTDF